MSVTSFKFYCFLLISVIALYIVPKKFRWVALLLFSAYFYLNNANALTLIYVLYAALVGYYGAKLIDKEEDENKRKRKLTLSLVLVVIPLAVLKYLNFIPLVLNSFMELFRAGKTFDFINFLIPLGISYYTLTLTAYLIDIYRDVYKPQKNVLKFITYTTYYPVLVSGPILRYNDMKKELFEERPFEWENLYQGFYRFIFGLLKKLVIADNLALTVNTIFSDPAKYSGVYIIIGVFFYALQIYADFSGCMDIIYGVSKMYGITLKENFRAPFLSKNLSEFWRRWHISLGEWGKDYVLYPMLKSKKFISLGKKCREKYGKKLGKKIPTILGTLLLWLLIGVWHGAQYKYIVAAGVIPWIYSSAALLCEDFLKKHSLNSSNIIIRILQSVRTVFFMCCLWLFVCADKLRDLPNLISLIFVRSAVPFFTINSMKMYIMIFVALVLVLITDILIYREKNPYEILFNRNVIIRWAVVFFVITIVIIAGCYGPGFNPSDFIYGGF